MTETQTLRSMAARLGMRASGLADAEPWTAERSDAHAAKHSDRTNLGYAACTDVQVASAVRMLMRDDLDHEAVVCAARDRICALHSEKAALIARIGELEAALRPCQAVLAELRDPDVTVTPLGVFARIVAAEARARSTLEPGQ